MGNADTEHSNIIDNAKGIAIILVVLGHSFPVNLYDGTTVIDQIAKIIYDFVYSFHMPVFFFLSGYLFYKSWISKPSGTILKKVKRLLIPYISFSVLYIPLRLFASSMANSEYGNSYWKILFGLSPNGGVWFLYTLFLFFVISYYVVSKKNITYFILVFGLCAFIVQSRFDFTNVIHSLHPRIVDFLRFYLYFLLGLYVKDMKLEKRLLEIKHPIIEVVILLLCFTLNEILPVSILSIGVALLGIHLTIIVSQKIEYSTHLAWLGKKSMDIYLLHGPIMVVLRTILVRTGIHKIAIASCMFIGAIGLSIIVSIVIIHRIRVFELLCTGVWRKKD